MSFDRIIGNDKIKDLLRKSISEHNILHSYLFLGQDGIGKRLFAKELSKMILCSSFNACDNCKSCLEFNSNNHPDFLMIDLEER